MLGPKLLSGGAGKNPFAGFGRASQEPGANDDAILRGLRGANDDAILRGFYGTRADPYDERGG